MGIGVQEDREQGASGWGGLDNQTSKKTDRQNNSEEMNRHTDSLETPPI